MGRGATLLVLLVLLVLLALGLSCGQFFKCKGPAVPVGPLEDFLVYDTPPSLVSSARPEYPEIAREVGAEGRVLLKVLVLEDGRVGGVQVLEATHQILADNAIAAVEKCVFSPALSKGAPVRATVVMPFVFSLSGSYMRTSVTTEAEEPSSGAVPVEPPRQEEPPPMDTKQK